MMSAWYHTGGNHNARVPPAEHGHEELLPSGVAI